MAQIRERLKKDGTKSYLVRIRIKGQSDVTATFSRQTDAKRWAQQTEVEIRSGSRGVGGRGGRLFSDLTMSCSGAHGAPVYKPNKVLFH